MRVLALSFAFALLGRTAQANECNSLGPQLSTADVPLGCPALVALPIALTTTNPPYQPTVSTTRYDTHTGQPMQIDLTGTVMRDPDVQLQVGEYRYHGTCDLQYDGLEPQTYAMFEVTLTGAQIGDLIEAGASNVPGSGPLAHVVAAGPCPSFAQPELACAEPYQGCNADAGVHGEDMQPPGGGSGNGGCDAGGAGGLGLALLVLLTSSSLRASRRPS